jgi:uncharacterized membrane protein SirB2
MTYALLKNLHVACAIISIAGFALRFAAMLRGAAWLSSRLARTLPHVVDTALLASAIALSWKMDAVPVRDAWLTAKIVALLGYIVLGTIALRRGRTMAHRAAAGVAALLVFGYIASVAASKSALGFLGGLVG